MTAALSETDLQRLAPGGHFIGLRISYSFPQEQINTFPANWVKHYMERGLMPHDPVVKWVFGNLGAIRWRELAADDPFHVFRQAQAFGLRYGVSVAYQDSQKDGQRSFGSFVRADRDFEDAEIRLLEAHLRRLHHERLPPRNLTAAELEVLHMVKQGQRLKQMAFELGVSQGAVKQRLRNARIKLGAKTGSEAAVRAAGFNLI